MSRVILSRSVLRTIATGSSAVPPAALATTGSAVVDARLGGGLVSAALHEVYAVEDDRSDAAAGFTLLLAWRGRGGKPIIWVREDRGERGYGCLYIPGLVELGVDPDTIILVNSTDTLAGLRAGVDIADCGAVGAVVIEPWGKALALDLNASRRLALAAARSGVMTLVLRSGATPAPSAATTRWSVATAPSPTMVARAPGRPAFDISLLRHRGGIAGFEARVEWDRDRGIFCDIERLRTPLSGRFSAAAPVRTFADYGRRAA